MSGIFKLPTEGHLQILSHLIIPEISTYQQVCKHFNAIIQGNPFSVYRSAAITHKYVSSNPPPATLEEAVKEQQNLFGARVVACWKDFCEIRWRIDMAWKKPVFPRESYVYCSSMDPFSRICLDDKYLLLPAGPRTEYKIVNLENGVINSRLVPEGDLSLSSHGYLIFKVTRRRYVVWHREIEWTELTDTNLLRYIGTFELDGRWEVRKMRGDCLMMVTERNTLYIFHFNPLLIASMTEAISSPHEIEPTARTDISFVGHFNHPNEIAYTTSIDFDEECIFHCTSQGVRILSRSSFNQLYMLWNAPWQKVARGQWIKCFTSNTYFIPRKTQPPMDSREGDVVLVQKGASEGRKAKDWRWDALNVCVEDGMVVMNFPGGWIVALPDYRSLISGERTLDDGLGCWVLDIGTSCTGMVFDGRRIVCMEGQRHLILNLHDIPGRIVTSNTPVVRLVQQEWTPTGTIQNMVLNDWSLSFLGLYDHMDNANAVVWTYQA